MNNSPYCSISTYSTFTEFIHNNASGYFVFDNNILPDDSTNTGPSIGTSSNKWYSIYANTFYGALNGNATTATNAQRATQDGDGYTISSTYLKLSGGVMTGALTVKGLHGTVD